MSQPIHIKSDNTQHNGAQTEPNVLKFWRVAFKINFERYNFSKYDQLTASTLNGLFEPEIFKHHKIYDLCRIHNKYKRYHPDFVQTYFLDLFKDTNYPCSIFIFIEEVSMQKGNFVQEPHPLTINHRSAQKLAQDTGKVSSKSLNSKIDEIKADYEMFYIETPHLQLTTTSLTGQCLALTSNFIRGTKSQTGKALLKPLAYACYADSQGMTFFKFTGFRGLMPKLKPSSTLLPVVLLIGMTLGFKQSVLRLNRSLVTFMSKNMKANMGLKWLPGRYLKLFTNMYRQLQQFAACSYLSNITDYKNAPCHELFNELNTCFGLSQDYIRLQDHVKVLSQMIQQMETKLILKSQRHIRMAIFLLGLSIVVSAGIVCTILGIEPMIRLLVDLGILPADMLNLLHPIAAP